MKGNEIIAKSIIVSDSLDKMGVHIPILLLSQPGYTKTTTVGMLAKVLDYNFFTLIPSQYSYDDILGLETTSPESLKENSTFRVMPSWLRNLNKLAKNNKRNLLFIDEITTCNSLIQGPLLNLVFSKSLGEYSLPSNTLIVASGNYSIDLDDSFSLLSPMVNRFMLVNLNKKDFDINEILDDKISTLTKREDYARYLNLKKEKNLILYNSILEYLRSICQFSNNSNCEYIDGVGQVGFTSVRSLSYSIKYLKAYLSLFSDNYWTHIIGDTLGYCEDNEKLWRVILDAFVDSQRVAKGDTYFYNIKKLLTNSQTRFGEVLDYLQNAKREDKQTLTLTEMQQIKEMLTENKNGYSNEEIKTLVNFLN